MLTEEMLEQLGRLIRPLRVRVANMTARAVVSLVDDARKLQELQIDELEGGPYDEAERFQQYGFSSIPFAGAECVVLFPNGDRSHPLVIAVDDRAYRPTGGQPGEVVIYTDEGDEIRLGRGRVMSLTSDEIRLGSTSAADPVALKSDLDALATVFSNWTPVANDGGAALKSALTTLLQSWPTCSSKVKAE